MAYLVLIRHGLSEYNKQGLWTGWTDSPLAPEGKEEAQKAAAHLSALTFDQSFTSPLSRCIQTLNIIKQNMGKDIPTTIDKALSERNYGDYTGKNKWEIEKRLGEEEFLKLRRSWSYPIPNGESLQQVYERVIPYYTSTIAPLLREGKNILIVSSGNALRALIKYLENITDENIEHVEIQTGESYIYKINKEGNIESKAIR